MIVPMKKATIIVQSKNADSAIAKLRSLGIMHVEYQQPPQGRDINLAQTDIALTNDALRILSQGRSLKELCQQIGHELDDWRFTAKHIIDLHKRQEQLKEFSLNLQNKISQWEKWGDFDPQLIESLKSNNINIKLYQLPLKEFKKLPKDIIKKVISRSKGIVNCLLISRQKIDIPFKEAALPKTGLAKMRERLEEADKVQQSLEKDISKQACYCQALSRIKKSLEKELEFHQALKGMGAHADFRYLTGYVPFDIIDSLVSFSKKERWATVIEEPSDEDNVPTLIRNPRWVTLINPLFKIVEIVPGYREFDISMWFLIFFSVFFGMLIGDAAYGAIFFILTLLAHIKWGRRLRDKSVFNLFYVLSTCAIIWGGLTATFFGQEWLPQTVKPILPSLRSSRNLQVFCFALGGIHLTIAHLWRAIIKLPSLIALSDMGWILILWGGFYLARLLILGEALPLFAKWLIIAGTILVIFFTSIKKNVLKGIGQGFGNLLLNLVNSFTDLVSYIRLFAVGLATVAVADAFNKMAMDVGFNSIVSGLITALILLVGHGLNILLGPMAVLVHGLRLNVLEFCNHLDIKWSGFAYKPLEGYVDSK